MRKAHSPEEFNEGAIYCRSFGHAWKPYTAPYDKKARQYNVTLVCANGCSTEKHFTLSQRGEYASPSYSYGDGYLATFTVTPEDKESLRLEALSDVLGPASNVTNINTKKNGTK